MNNENKPSVIAELTAALASMAERAAAAEAELDRITALGESQIEKI